MLANSLKESVSAQSKVVDKLFDELKDLSRKIDEKRQAPQPLPPIVVNMQSPGAAPPGPPPMKPIVMDMPRQPQAEGLPRYATSDMGDEGEEEEQASIPSDDEAVLEEVPEDLEPLEQDVAEQAPQSWPGLEPITDAEPEPEIATGGAEAAGASEETGAGEPQPEPVEEAAELLPETETPAEASAGDAAREAGAAGEHTPAAEPALPASPLRPDPATRCARSCATTSMASATGLMGAKRRPPAPSISLTIWGNCQIICPSARRSGSSGAESASPWNP